MTTADDTSLVGRSCPIGDMICQSTAFPPPRAKGIVDTMNDEHLDFCSSMIWREMLTESIIPWAVGSVDLGHDVLEVGPGPGLATEYFASRMERLTAVEIDSTLAGALAERMAGSNVDVVNADATDLPFADARFSGAVSFTMLHHVPTGNLQDVLLREVARVLVPGAAFIISDSVASRELEAMHDGDIYNPVDPEGVPDRLIEAGFVHCKVRRNDFGWAALGVR